ncbi:MAG TPA: sugar phosphate isomerase/epimerase, partial [Candidatus Sulfopaludibacter sp.]|nr:sugar phosphate isomerase/epimerase [Candidatus Sulfopaludibacter sp.]
RTFLKSMAAAGGFATLSNELMADASPDWKKQVGLELFTVRDLMQKDFEGTLARVAEIGYKEVEPAGGYNNLDPKQFRAMLDRYGLSMPSTHSGATDGPDLEKQLEGFQVMGIQYTEVRGGGGGRGMGGPGGGRAQGGAPGGGGAGGGRRGPGGPGGGMQRPPQSVESVKRSAEQLNKHGAVVQKFGMKILIHNHTGEFELLDDGRQTQYDVLLAETDPALVAMQLDIGWASVAGKNILEMFARNAGRYELWHVKDAVDIRNVDPHLTPSERQRIAKLVPVGLGEVDYRTIFSAAKVAGLKHFCVEQDSAAQWGDSMAASRVSFQNLVRILS